MGDEDKEPSMSDIAKMIAAIDKKLDTKVEAVKTTLTKAIDDQAAHYQKTLKNTINEVVEPLDKKHQEFEKRCANLKATVANLTDLV